MRAQQVVTVCAAALSVLLTGAAGFTTSARAFVAPSVVPRALRATPGALQIGSAQARRTAGSVGLRMQGDGFMLPKDSPDDLSLIHISSPRDGLLSRMPSSA